MNILKTLKALCSIGRMPKGIYDKPMPLRIEGIPDAPLTPEPDEAETAAAALLESLAAGRNEKKKSKNKKTAQKGSKEYYEQLSDNIREAHAAEARAAQRYISYTEQRLHTAASSDAPGGSLAELEAGLFKHQYTVEREGGELLSRWQHCLADLTVLQMQAAEASGDNDITDMEDGATQ